MSDDHSARLALPYLAAGQMQKHVTLNEALTRLDALVQTAVVSRTTLTQPATPDDGALWILPAGATGSDWGLWQTGTLVRAEGGGWTVVETEDGLVALVLDDGELVVRHAGDWAPLGTRLGVNVADGAALGATVGARVLVAATVGAWVLVATAVGADVAAARSMTAVGLGVDVLGLGRATQRTSRPTMPPRM